jgi:hypothetical protein
MKLKKKVFPLLLSLIITPCLFAQKISYTYDSAGNRTSRQYDVTLPAGICFAYPLVKTHLILKLLKNSLVVRFVA